MRKQVSFACNTGRLYRENGNKVQKRALKTPRNKTGKQWPSDFYTLRSIYQESNQTDDEIENDVVSSNGPRAEQEQSDRDSLISDDPLDSFLGELEGSIPSSEAKTVRNFVTCAEDESSDSRTFETWAWMDDREHSSGRSRDYPRGLNATELRDNLEKKRYGQSRLSNADRRLIYISKLTPKFILALAETAWNHQIGALLDAIWKHIALETSFRVHIPVNGFLTFRLEFHLAHLILRKPKSTPQTTVDGGKGAKKSLVDLAFLNVDNSAGRSSNYSIYQAHISVVVCGWSNYQWTGYAFARTGLEEVPFEEPDEYEPKHDFFAADRDDDYVKDANIPIWDARRYWLQIVAIRCQLILKEWLYLTCTLEDAVDAWKVKDPCSNSLSHANLDPKNIQKSLDWTMQTMQLLRKLRDSLSMTLRAYKRFDESGGDKCYFSDITDYSRVQNSIKESFEKLADLYLRLSSLDDSCKRFATHLGRILSLESNRLTAESNRLDKESNKLNAESHKLSKQTHNLNVRTSVLSDKLRELNERSTEAACANQADAAKMSRSTRVNIELLLFTTPFGMVLQYFGSDTAIFSFNRNPKTFVLATLILMLVLRLFTLLLEHAGFLLKMIPWKTPARSK